MADRGDGKPLSAAKIAKLLMIDDSEVNRIVSKFKFQFSELATFGTQTEYSLMDGTIPDEE